LNRTRVHRASFGGLGTCLGLPVFQRKGWYLPDVTPLGLGIVIALGIAIYWAIASIFVKLLAKMPRGA
jgi:hypothetical protein